MQDGTFPLRNEHFYVRLTVIDRYKRRVTSYDGPYGALFASAIESTTKGEPTLDKFESAHKKLVGWSAFGAPFTEQELNNIPLEDVVASLKLTVTDDTDLIKKIASYGFKQEDYHDPDHLTGYALNPERSCMTHDAAIFIDLRKPELSLLCGDATYAHLSDDFSALRKGQVRIEAGKTLTRNFGYRMNGDWKIKDIRTDKVY